MVDRHGDRIPPASFLPAAERFGLIHEIDQDADTLATVRKLGVDYAQGFHLGRPEPAEDDAQAEQNTERAAPAVTMRD